MSDEVKLENTETRFAQWIGLASFDCDGCLAWFIFEYFFFLGIKVLKNIKKYFSLATYLDDHNAAHTFLKIRIPTPNDAFPFVPAPAVDRSVQQQHQHQHQHHIHLPHDARNASISRCRASRCVWPRSCPARYLRWGYRLHSGGRLRTLAVSLPLKEMTVDRLFCLWF